MIAFQPEFRPFISTVRGPKDYRDFCNLLVAMDRILVETGLEINFVKRHIASNPKRYSNQTFQSAATTATKALRYSILLSLTEAPFRELAFRVADSSVFKWFTCTSRLDGAQVVSKSTIERFEKMFSKEDVAQLIHDVNRCFTDENVAKELLFRDEKLRFEQFFADCTCVKVNIHFPVDWLLLSDAVRTLIKAVKLIRSHGIKHRISDPDIFIRKMNKLCMEMTHLRKKPNAPKKRKAVLRRMKRLTKTVECHAKNYQRALSSNWEKSDLSEAATQVILSRIENVLEQLPQAIKQAHERIIGGRRVKNKDKILSLYERDVHVIVRGKAGAEVEFGNGFYLAEQSEGLIIDWHYFKEQPPNDSKLVVDSIKRISTEYGEIKSYTADRAFDSKPNRDHLESHGIINAICPRSVPALKLKLEDEDFCRLQKRRGSTEARIAIFKINISGNRCEAKGL